MVKKSKLYSTLSPLCPWERGSDQICLASTLKIYRNIDNYCFPGRLEEEKRHQLLEVLKQGIFSLDILDSPLFLKAEELSPIEKEYLFEHFLASESFHQAHVGEAFVIDQSGEFLAILNVRDHLQLQITDHSGDLEGTWNRLVKLEVALGRILSFSFSKSFGFLTAGLNHCGTGVSVHVYLHVPGLIHSGKLSMLLEENKDEYVKVVSMQGKIDQPVGDIIVLSNTYSLGVTEENIINHVRQYLTKLIIAEKSSRTQLRNENNLLVRDKVARSLALLLHNYQLNTVETLNALGLCRLGVDLGWVKGVSETMLSKLFINCRRAHLTQSLSLGTDVEEISKKRSEYVKKNIKKASLAT